MAAHPRRVIRWKSVWAAAAAAEQITPIAQIPASEPAADDHHGVADVQLPDGQGAIAIRNRAPVAKTKALIERAVLEGATTNSTRPTTAITTGIAIRTGSDIACPQAGRLTPENRRAAAGWFRRR
jgi:hypothetical protein